MGVVGPNGAGKSTLFNVIVSLLPATSGRVLVHSRSIAEARGLVAYVPQHERVNWRLPMSAWGRGAAWAHAAGRIGSGVRGGRTVPWQRRRCGKWVCGTVAVPWWASFPADSGSGCSSPAPWPRRRTSSCWTRLSAGWTSHPQESLVSVLTELRDQGHTILMSSHDINHLAHYCG